MHSTMRRNRRPYTVALLFTGAFVFIYFTYFHTSKPMPMVWPRNQTRNADLMIHPEKVTTLIQPRNVCGRRKADEDDNDVYLLVVVCSAMRNHQERQAIRQSWAKDQESLPNIKVVFLLGTSTSSSRSNASIAESIQLQANVTQEADSFGDILQEDFVDSYANLTIKSLMMLKWMSTSKCATNVPYLLKTDDDMYVNLHNLYQLVANNKNPYLMIGSVICGAKPIRDPYNKWHSPEYMYKGRVYPMYLSGTGYLMSAAAAGMLYQVSHLVPMFHMEDIYVTGFLRTKVNEGAKVSDQAKVSLQVTDDLRFSLVKVKDDPCIHSKVITSHHYQPDKLKSIYSNVKSLKEGSCPSKVKPKSLRPYPIDPCWWRATHGPKKKVGRKQL